ncbi:unnamed protein product [Brachionus calyciflorus]|uniref:RING-type domain-containing protein n=1 Tax=Brachionus calyciflorus TaxID=104777 RepID=A0A813U8D2_9BILA|nr:unnamed protein product [Brachionus calyciflorus]
MDIVTIYDNSSYISKTIEYEPNSETIETLLIKFDSTLDHNFITFCCGDTKFLDFKTKIETCLFYGESFIIYNHKIKLFIKPDTDDYAPFDIEVDSRKEFFEVIWQIRQKLKIFNFKLKGKNDEDFDDIDCLIKDYELTNNSELKLLIEKDKTSRTIQFMVRNYDKKVFFLQEDSYSLIEDVKIKIEKCNKSELELFVFKFGSYIIEDLNRILDDYNFEDMVNVQVMRKMIGGDIDFADLDTEPEKYLPENFNLEWRKIKPGLCLEGKCQNSDCIAYEQMVIMNLGVPLIYNLGKPDYNHLTICPICKFYVKPLTCGFFKCKWRFRGLVQSQLGSERVGSHWKITEDEYVRFSNDEKPLAKWHRLVIETQVDSFISSGELTRSNTCAICFDENGFICESSNMNCIHKFHELCLRIWLQRSKTCPICRSLWNEMKFV